VQLHGAAGAHTQVHGSLHADRLQQIHSMHSIAVSGGAQRPLQVIEVPHAHRVYIAHCAHPRCALSTGVSVTGGAEDDMDSAACGGRGGTHRQGVREERVAGRVEGRD